MSDAKVISSAEQFRSKLEGRLTGLRTDRYSWWIHWAELARYILPRRYRWLVTPNQYNRGAFLNTAIIDSTATIAARALAAGMMSGITSPNVQWFDLRIEGYDKDEINSVNLWLAECRRRMMRVFAESNFYNSIAVVYMDLGVFGTAPMLIYEDRDNIIDCVNPCAGEYYLGLGSSLRPQIFYREMVLTVAQMEKDFGIDNCSKDIQKAYKDGGAALQQEVAVVHAIEPNCPGSGVPKVFPIAEYYWERGSVEKGSFLRKKGYHELPGIFPRWDVTGNDAYGRSPGMDALGDTKQLQQEQKRKAQAIDKLANPPMKADVELKNQPASTIPGGVTYITKKDGVGFSPVYENFRPPIQELMEDIKQVQDRIQRIFFNDLFLMFQQMDAEPRSAAAVDVRREEKLVMIGPVLERFFTEGLDPTIDRVFNIMNRRGLLPPPPPEIQNAPIQVEYSSMLAAAQRATQTAGIERVFGLAGNIAAIHPDILDVPNWDRGFEKYSALLGNDPDLINPPEVIAQARQQKAKAQQMQYLTDVGQGAAKAGKTLSETEVGGGQNALQAMIGGPQ
jgi:hypothetical protein